MDAVGEAIVPERDSWVGRIAELRLPCHDVARGTEHYFSDSPGGDARPQTLDVELAGRRLTVRSVAGVFSAHRVDPGTRLLMESVPPPPDTGALLDLGCGWGPMALSLALHSPDADVYAVDVNPRALSAVRSNAEQLRLERVRAMTPDEMPADLRFRLIWSNPPIRVGKLDLHRMLARWLPRLEDAGVGYLVVQRHLGADTLHAWIDSSLPGLSCRRLRSAKGYRILQVSRG